MCRPARARSQWQISGRVRCQLDEICRQVWICLMPEDVSDEDLPRHPARSGLWRDESRDGPAVDGDRDVFTGRDSIEQRARPIA